MKANLYNLIARAAALPVTLDEVKTALRWPLADTSQDDYFTLLIESAQESFEAWTGRTLIQAQYETFRDCWEDFYILERADYDPEGTVAIEYTTDTATETLPTTQYDIARRIPYAKLYFLGLDTEADLKDGYDRIRITFYAGFGDESTDIPADIKLGLLNHISAMYFNRGDCGASGDCGACPLPAETQKTYRQYRIPITDCAIIL